MDRLYLIEILVDNVQFSDVRLAKEMATPDNLLRVRVKFIDFPCFEINQMDFTNSTDASPTDFSSGKSCLFAMHPVDLTRAMKNFPLSIIIFKAVPNKKDPQILGQTKIPFSDTIIQSVRNSLNQSSFEQISNIMNEKFPLKSASNRDVGTISVFIRFTCLGQNIMTQFKLLEENKHFLFKNNQVEMGFQCTTCAPMTREEDGRSRNDVVPVDPVYSTEENLLDENTVIIPDRKRVPVPWRLYPGNTCGCNSNVDNNPLRPRKHKVPCSQVSESELISPGGGDRAPPCPCSDEPHLICNEFSRKKEKFNEEGVCRCPEGLCPGKRGVEVGRWTKHPMIRYDTTGRLSPAYQGPVYTQNPPVRYDTTGCLSPAYNGEIPPPDILMSSIFSPRPQVRYDTTGCLSPAYYLNKKARRENVTMTFRKGVRSEAERRRLANSQAYQYLSLSEQRRRESNRIKARKRRKSPKLEEEYDYSVGDEYPGTGMCHRKCIDKLNRVPYDMGWMWSVDKRKGWKPGSLPKSVKNIIDDHRLKGIMRTAALEPPSPTTKKRRTARIRISRPGVISVGSDDSDDDDEPEETPPTLHVHRVDGTYYVTVHPSNLGNRDEMVPLQFKIPKRPKPEVEGSSEVESSSDASELEIEFTAPGAAKYVPVKAPRVSQETQYDVVDFGGKEEKSKKDESEEQANDEKSKKDKKKNDKEKEKDGGEFVEEQTKEEKPKKEKKRNDRGKGKTNGRNGGGKVAIGKKENEDKGGKNGTPDKIKEIDWDKDDQPTEIGKKHK